MLCQLKIRIEEHLEMLLNSAEVALGIFFELDRLAIGCLPSPLEVLFECRVCIFVCQGTVDVCGNIVHINTT